MEVTTRTVSRNRCSSCRQEGHNRTRCPYDAATATSLRDAYNRERREFHRQLIDRALRPQPPRSRTPEPEWRSAVHAQVVDMRERLEALTRSGASIPHEPNSGPTVREVKIQEILFDRCQEIPEGLYKELMDALVLRG